MKGLRRPVMLLWQGQGVLPLETAFGKVFESLRIPQSEIDDTGLDVRNTPARVARMYRDELLSSYKPGAYEELCNRFTCFDSDGKDSLIVLGPCDFHSLCGHHMLPFTGEAWVGYIPGQKIVGASKVPRVVEFYSRMLQIQERMGRQIADFIYEQAKAKCVLVHIKAQHLCIACRGVRAQNVRMLTTAVAPVPTGPDAHRAVIDEFYSQIAIAKNA